MADFYCIGNLCAGSFSVLSLFISSQSSLSVEKNFSYFPRNGLFLLMEFTCFEGSLLILLYLVKF